MADEMKVVNIIPKLSTAEYALRKEEVGNALYDIIKKYITLSRSDPSSISDAV